MMGIADIVSHENSSSETGIITSKQWEEGMDIAGCNCWSSVGQKGRIGWVHIVGLCHPCKQNRGNGWAAGCIVTAGGGHWSSLRGRGNI